MANCLGSDAGNRPTIRDTATTMFHRWDAGMLCFPFSKYNDSHLSQKMGSSVHKTFSNSLMACLHDFNKEQIGSNVLFLESGCFLHAALPCTPLFNPDGDEFKH